MSYANDYDSRLLQAQAVLKTVISFRLILYCIRLPLEKRRIFVEEFNQLYPDLKSTAVRAEQLLLKLRNAVEAGQFPYDETAFVILLNELGIQDVSQLIYLLEYSSPQQFYTECDRSRCGLKHGGSDSELISRFLKKPDWNDPFRIDYRARYFSSTILKELVVRVDSIDNLTRTIDFFEEYFMKDWSLDQFGGSELGTILASIQTLQEKCGQLNQADMSERLERVKRKIHEKFYTNPKSLRVIEQSEIDKARSRFLTAIDRDDSSYEFRLYEGIVLFDQQGLNDFIDQALNRFSQYDRPSWTNVGKVFSIYTSMMSRIKDDLNLVTSLKKWNDLSKNTP